MLENLKAFVTVPGWNDNKKNQPFGRSPGTSKRLRGYTAGVWQFACARFLANSITAIPWGFVIDGEEVEENHPAVEMMKFANEDENFIDILKSTMIDYKQAGYAIWLPQIMLGKIIRYKYVPASQVVLDISGDILKGVWWNTKNTQVYLPWQSFLFFKDHGSMHPLRFDSPASVSIDNAQISQGFNTNLVSHLENYSVSPYVFTSTQNIKQPDLDRYTNMWNAMWSKLKNRFKATFIGGGLTPTRLVDSLKDMIFPELKKENRIEICAAYGVLPSLVGAVTQVNRADRIEQVKTTYNVTVIPDAKYFASVINAFMQPFMFQNAEFKFFPEKVELLQEERSGKSDRIINEVEIGLLTIEAGAKILGYTKDMIGEIRDRNIIVDPQSQASRKLGEKAEWKKFYKKLAFAKDYANFNFYPEFIEPEIMDDAIKAIRSLE